MIRIRGHHSATGCDGNGLLVTSTLSSWPTFLRRTSSDFIIFVHCVDATQYLTYTFTRFSPPHTNVVTHSSSRPIYFSGANPLLKSIIPSALYYATAFFEPSLFSRFASALFLLPPICTLHFSPTTVTRLSNSLSSQHHLSVVNAHLCISSSRTVKHYSIGLSFLAIRNVDVTVFTDVTFSSSIAKQRHLGSLIQFKGFNLTA